MSKLPQLNLRIPADYHQLVRDIAARLRERDAPSFAHELDALVMGLAAAPPMPTAPREMLRVLHPGGKVATVCETSLVPGPDALLSFAEGERVNGASIEATLELWASSLRDVKARIRPLFLQERMAQSAGLFLDALLGPERRKTGWMRAEAAGDPGP